MTPRSWRRRLLTKQPRLHQRIARWHVSRLHSAARCDVATVCIVCQVHPGGASTECHRAGLLHCKLRRARMKFKAAALCYADCDRAASARMVRADVQMMYLCRMDCPNAIVIVVFLTLHDTCVCLSRLFRT